MLQILVVLIYDTILMLYKFIIVSFSLSGITLVLILIVTIILIKILFSNSLQALI